jgi:hypothetical protein
MQEFKVIPKFIKFVQSKPDDKKINQDSFITCAIGDYHRHIRKPLKLNENFKIDIENSSPLYLELSSISTARSSSLTYDINDCNTYGELKKVLSNISLDN